MKNLVLICGGQSPEHEISVRSAKNILAAIDRDTFHVITLGISKSGKWYELEESALGLDIADAGPEIFIRPGSNDCFIREDGSSLGSVDVIFPILHGPNGEDGTVQGLFTILNIPFVGPGVLGSSVSMDKDVAKKLLRASGIAVSKWVLLRRNESHPSYAAVAEKLGNTLFVKPANMGSSVGVSKVTNDSEWKAALEDAFSYDTKVLVEELISGRELECAVLGNDDPKASGVGEVETNEVYSYEEKYSDASTTKVTIPARVTAGELAKIKEVAIDSYKCLECEGLSRVDVFLTDQGEVYVNEVNTMPGFTSISMYPQLWMEQGWSYTALISELIKLAIDRHQ